MNHRQTVFFLPVDPMDKNHKDPDTIDLNAPRHAQYMHKPWKRHQNAVYWVDINLARSSIRLYRTRSFFTFFLPAYRIPKVGRMETGQVIYEKENISHRLLPKISLKHGLEKRIEFIRCSTTRRTSCATIQNFPIEPTNSKPRS